MRTTRKRTPDFKTGYGCFSPSEGSISSANNETDGEMR